VNGFAVEVTALQQRKAAKAAYSVCRSCLNPADHTEFWGDKRVRVAAEMVVGEGASAQGQQAA
jgi:hypothetical protein